MQYFYMIFFPLLYLSFVCFGSKLMPKGEWNDEFCGIKQSKAIQGAAAIGIIFHHMAQQTCAPWLSPTFKVNGLNFFLDLGAPFVAIFFFFSGYGLYKSLKTKEDYFDDYFKRRLTPIIIVWLFTTAAFYYCERTLNPYAWFVYAIVMLYVVFRIAYGPIKNEVISMALILLAIAGYAVFCDVQVLGEWLYNTILLFPAGILFAKGEKKLVPFLKKNYIGFVIVSVLVTAIGFTGNTVLNSFRVTATDMGSYNMYRLLQAGSVCVGSFGFVSSILALGMKAVIGNKAINFCGTMTLEIYLAHVTYAELFAHGNGTKTYIRSLPLYVLATLACGLLFAYGLKMFQVLLKFINAKEFRFVESVKKSSKKWLLAIGIIAVLYLVFLFANDRMELANRQKLSEQYAAEELIFVNVDGKSMAVLDLGAEEGRDTLVLMRGMNDPCPTCTMRGFAEELSKTYRTVVIDFFGSGYSDSTDSPRTMENICAEIHEAVSQLDIEGQYILVPEEISCIYAQYYTNVYHDEVKAVVNLESTPYSAWKTFMEYNRSNIFETIRSSRAQAARNGFWLRVAQKTGVSTTFWPIENWIYRRSFEGDAIDTPYVKFFEQYYSPETVDEIANNCYSYEAVADMPFPDDIPVIDIVSSSAVRETANLEVDLKLDWMALHNDPCPNPDLHTVIGIENVPGALFSNPSTLREVVCTALGNIGC